MFKIHKKNIRNPDEAIRIADYLKIIEANNINIVSYANILEKNKEIIEKLLSINKCNMIKTWLIEAEEGLCYEGSHALLMIFWIFGCVCIGFWVLFVSANMGYKVLE